MVDLDDTVEISFSDLGLHNASFLSTASETDVSVDELDGMISAIDDELVKTAESIQAVVSRNLPMFVTTFRTTEEVYDQVDNLQRNIAKAVRYLSSNQSFQGQMMEYEEKLETSEKRIRELKVGIELFKEIKKILELMEYFDDMLECGCIERTSITINELEANLSALEEEMLDIFQRKDEEENAELFKILPHFDPKLVLKAIAIEVTLRRASLKKRLMELSMEMISFKRKKDEICLSILENMNKSLADSAASEEYNQQRLKREKSVDDEEPLDSFVTLSQLLVAMNRLDLLDFYLLETFGPKFFDEILLPCIRFPYYGLKKVNDDSSYTKSIVLSIEENSGDGMEAADVQNLVKDDSLWGVKETFVARYEKMLLNLTVALEFISKNLLDDDAELIEKFCPIVWGKSHKIKNGTMKSSERKCLSYLLREILVNYLPENEEFLFNSEASHMLSLTKKFESTLESLGFIKDKLYVKILSDYVLTAEARIIDKKRDSLLVKARDIIVKDYYKTKKVTESQERCSLLNVTGFQEIIDKGMVSLDSLTEEQMNNLKPEEVAFARKILDLLYQTFEKRSEQNKLETELYKFGNRHLDYFCLPDMLVSNNAKKLIDFCYTIMDNLVLKIKANADSVSQYYIDSMFQTCRDVFMMFLFLEKPCHSKIIENNSKYAMVFFNDCEYFAHHLAVFSFIYRKYNIS